MLKNNFDESSATGEPEIIAVTNHPDYAVSGDLPNYTQPEKGRKYILFLKKVEPKNIFTPASVAFQIEIDQTNKGKLNFNNNKNAEKEVLTKSKKEMIVFSIESDSDDIEALDTITGKTHFCATFAQSDYKQGTFG